ncbi:DUF327 family protein [Treponema sp.]|uniref:DUF327 family protein n=1 Tax=Treponema sp. TaxID=166 RepID=UPI00298E8F44|nr:DUF327 family protein [Treponema sp.]MCR5612759.1 YaaR family protein [Treponema sp.]
MKSVDPTSGSLYFTAAASAAQSQAAREAQKQKQTEKIGKKFSSLVRDKQEENYLVSQGLPPELSGMSIDDAVDYLKDELDMAGDNLGINATPQAFDRYKKAVGQFMKFLEKNNYTIDIHKRMPKRGKTVKPAFQVIAINEKLDRLAYDLWYNHLDKLKLLEKVHEINGLVIDLLAS